MRILRIFLLLCYTILLFGADAQEGGSPSSIDALFSEKTLHPNPSSLFGFESNTVYMCASQYRLTAGHKEHQQLSEKEKEKSYFELVFNEEFSRLRTSDTMVYSAVRSTAKGKLFSKKVAIQGKNVYYKIRILSAKGIYKSVFVAGYGDLIHDFVQCKEKEI